MEEGGVGEAQGEAVDVPAEVPANAARLGLAEEVGLVVAQEAREPDAASDRRAEAHGAGLLLLDVEDDVHVSALRREDVGKRQRGFEEAQRLDVLVGLQHPAWLYTSPREQKDLLANDAVVGEVVSGNHDAVDVGLLPLQDPPHRANGAVLLLLVVGFDPREEVALVGIALLDLPGGLFEGDLVEDAPDPAGPFVVEAEDCEQTPGVFGEVGPEPLVVERAVPFDDQFAQAVTAAPSSTCTSMRALPLEGSTIRVSPRTLKSRNPARL